MIDSSFVLNEKTYDLETVVRNSALSQKSPERLMIFPSSCKFFFLLYVTTPTITAMPSMTATMIKVIPPEPMFRFPPYLFDSLYRRSFCASGLIFLKYFLYQFFCYQLFEVFDRFLIGQRRCALRILSIKRKNFICVIVDF